MMGINRYAGLLNGMIVIVIAVIVMTVGCATIPKNNEALERARTAYSGAKANPEISGNAPVAVHEASLALQKAEQAKNVEEMEHLAYLAERKAQLAVAIAEQRIAEKEAEHFSKEKDKILLESREREAEQARGEAEASARETKLARSEAEAKRIEAEQAKNEAESRMREAEQARIEAEKRTLEAEQARKDTEAKMREAEQARMQAETRKREAELAREQAEQAMTRAKQLEEELSELKAKQTERGIVLTIGDVLFATAKADLMPGAMLSMNKLVEFLEKNPTRNVLIEGHTDSVGSEEYNLVLSQRRADAVREALISKGISANRITAKGYGEKYPVANNENEAGRQQNRRVEIVILNEGIRGETTRQ